MFDYCIPTGKRYAADDERIIIQTKMVTEVIHILQGPVIFLDMMPWLLKIIPKSLIIKWTRMNVAFSNRDTVYAQYKVRYFLSAIHG